MLSCTEFLAEFGDYLEEAATPEVRARLEQHLHECKTCQVIVDSTRKTIRSLPIVTRLLSRPIKWSRS